MVKFTYEKYDPDYDHDDFYITEKASYMRRLRNVHFSFGCVVGAVSTVAFQYVWLWAIGIV